MDVLLSSCGSRGDVGPMSDLLRRVAELVTARVNTVAAAAEACDALVVTWLMPAGVWL